MFRRKVVEKIKTRILCPITFFWKSYLLWDNVEKYGRTGQAIAGNTRACALHAGYLWLQIHTQNITHFFDDDNNNGYTKGPRYGIICTRPVLLVLNLTVHIATISPYWLKCFSSLDYYVKSHRSKYSTQHFDLLYCVFPVKWDSKYNAHQKQNVKLPIKFIHQQMHSLLNLTKF